MHSWPRPHDVAYASSRIHRRSPSLPLATWRRGHGSRRSRGISRGHVSQGRRLNSERHAGLWPVSTFHQTGQTGRIELPAGRRVARRRSCTLGQLLLLRQPRRLPRRPCHRCPCTRRQHRPFVSSLGLRGCRLHSQLHSQLQSRPRTTLPRGTTLVVSPLLLPCPPTCHQCSMRLHLRLRAAPCHLHALAILTSTASSHHGACSCCSHGHGDRALPPRPRRLLLLLLLRLWFLCHCRQGFM